MRRVLSLLPSATEIVFALGLEGQLVGVTAECDHPSTARDLPSVSSPVVDAGGTLTAAEIDALVRARVAAGLPLYDLDVDLVRSLRPDLVLAQDLCRVCAVPSGDVSAALVHLGLDCEVLSLDPADLGGVLSAVLDVAAAVGDAAAGSALVARLVARLAAVNGGGPLEEGPSVHSEKALPSFLHNALSTLMEVPAPGPLTAGPSRRVVCLEWAAPPFVAGHWVPDMVALAGGTGVLGRAGDPSVQVDWADVVEARPEVVVFMPCGFDLAGAQQQAPAVLEHLAGLPGTEIWAVDATSYFSRPGPRLVDGVEALAHVLHPESAAPVPAGRVARVA